MVDIDDTLLIAEKDRCQACGSVVYKNVKPIQNEIDLLNQLYDAGNIIILFTGRNWNKYEITKKQLQEFGIKHHELVMGKPQGIYIDRTDCESSVIKAIERYNIALAVIDSITNEKEDDNDFDLSTEER
jgi:hypothetical protein